MNLHQLIYSYLLYQSKEKITFASIQKYVEQMGVERAEINSVLRNLLIHGVIDKTDRNKLCLAETATIHKETYCYSVNLPKDEVERLLNNDAIIQTGAGWYLHKSTERTNKTFSFSKSIKSLGFILNFLELCSEFNISTFDERYNPSTLIFEEKKSEKINDGLYSKKINDYYKQFYIVIDGKVYYLPENNYEMLSTVKLYFESELANKWMYDDGKQLVKIQFLTVPYYVERLLFINHILVKKKVPLDRTYHLSKMDLNNLKKYYFKENINITYAKL